MKKKDLLMLFCGIGVATLFFFFGGNRKDEHLLKSFLIAFCIDVSSNWVFYF